MVLDLGFGVGFGVGLFGLFGVWCWIWVLVLGVCSCVFGVVVWCLVGVLSDYSVLKMVVSVWKVVL